MQDPALLPAYTDDEQSRTESPALASLEALGCSPRARYPSLKKVALVFLAGSSLCLGGYSLGRIPYLHASKHTGMNFPAVSHLLYPLWYPSLTSRISSTSKARGPSTLEPKK